MIEDELGAGGVTSVQELAFVKAMCSLNRAMRLRSCACADADFGLIAIGFQGQQ
jgi:hypothetical protein